MIGRGQSHRGRIEWIGDLRRQTCRIADPRWTRYCHSCNSSKAWAIITDEYTLEPTRETVDALAVRLNKTPRSIIAKLAALGIYQKAERVTKRGEPVVMKAELVAQVQNAIGRELPSLNKMTKPDLQFMIDALVG